MHFTALNTLQSWSRTAVYAFSWPSNRKKLTQQSSIFLSIRQENNFTKRPSPLHLPNTSWGEWSGRYSIQHKVRIHVSLSKYWHSSSVFPFVGEKHCPLPSGVKRLHHKMMALQYFPLSDVKYPHPKIMLLLCINGGSKTRSDSKGSKN